MDFASRYIIKWDFTHFYICHCLPYPLSLPTASLQNQLMSVIAPNRYHKQLMDTHYPGVIEILLGMDQQCYSVRVVRSKSQYTQEKVFYFMVAIVLVLMSPCLQYITWRKQLAILQKVKGTKGGPAVMWACIAWMPLANLYTAVKFIISTSHFAVTENVQRENDISISITVTYTILYSSIVAVIQSGKALPGLPNCGALKTVVVRRVLKFHVWCNFNILVALILAKSPFAVLLAGTNPFLYGSALLAIVLAASLPILLTATLFTIGQVFLEDPDFRLTWREAVRQAGWLLLVGTGCVGVALFLGCICFLLLLSKDGNKVQSVSGVASFLMRHVVLTSLPLLMQSLIRFIRNVHL